MATSAEELVGLTLGQIIIGTAGVGLLIYTLYLTRESNRATIRAAKAAEDAVEVTRDAAKRQLRAWISSPEIGLKINTKETPEGDRIDLIGFTFQWKNIGQTPAINTLMRAEGSVGTPIDNLKDSKTPRTTIGVGTPFGSQTIWFTTDQIMASQAESVIYIRGRIDYVDSFDEKDEHFTDRSIVIRYLGRKDVRTCETQVIGIDNFLIQEYGHLNAMT